MRAAYAEEGNLNDPLASLILGRRPLPTVPEGWVRVRVHAVALNWHDLFTLKGMGLHPPKFPLTLGCDPCGVLDDGTEVVIFPVMGNPDWKGDETLDPDRHVLSERVDGTAAEYLVVPHRNVIPRPKELSVTSASVLGIAWLTAYRMLFTRSGLRAGQTMLVQGSSGDVTTALIQLGSAAGMRVWCTGRTDEKRKLAIRLGAQRAFSPGEKVPELVDAVFDMNGETSGKHSIASVKTGGTVVVCGIHSGDHASAELFRVFTEQLNIHGVFAGTLEEFKDLINLIVAKGIKPEVGNVLPLELIAEGLRDCWKGGPWAKLV
ncbi:hypothetical protein MMC24_000270 [Lignoscripta atroalba]|nr:hypothetical protein [Lignoscripta atroalba]